MTCPQPHGAVESVLARRWLPEVTEHTATDREGPFDVLDEVRERGYAFDEERVDGIRRRAAPIPIVTTVASPR